MKRNNAWMAFFIAIITMGMFSSCSEDVRLAMNLEGEWRGDFGMSYTYIDRRGGEMTFDSYDTYIRFKPDYPFASKGEGTQVDYYRYGPYEYQYYRFRWRVDDGILKLTYPYDSQLNTAICDYRMSNAMFTGVFEQSRVHFSLYKLVDRYDWSPYNRDYGYYDRYNWYTDFYGPYYAPTRSADDVSGHPCDSTQNQGEIIKRFNRYTVERPLE